MLLLGIRRIIWLHHIDSGDDGSAAGFRYSMKPPTSVQEVQSALRSPSRADGDELIHHFSKGIGRLCFVPSKSLCFISNPKAGCSSVKAALWLAQSPSTYRGTPHAPDAPFKVTLDELAANREGLSGTSFFTVVRNPYVRALSAFLDKVQNRDDRRVWQQFAGRYGLSDDHQVSFDDFIRIITSDAPDELNPHFAPQHLNTFSYMIAPAFVGHLEQFDRVAEFLSPLGLELGYHAPHATGAQDHLSHFFAKETLTRVEAFFAQDFELFGYEQGIEKLTPTGDGAHRQDVSKLHSFLVERQLRNENRDLRQSRDGLLGERANLLDEQAKLREERNRYRAEADRLRAQFIAMHASTSWRITAPLRAAATLTKPTDKGTK